MAIDNFKYGKSKIASSDLPTIKDYDYSDSYRVGIKSGSENLIIDYLTNLYSNKATSIVRELFTNASDASISNPDYPINIEIKRLDDADNFSFRITDYGCGMSADELEKNYVTYASSTKTDDYDTIGSFGLGSKSPMALVPKYIVESNNGSEQNIVEVSRTDRGIFGKTFKSDEVKDYSFTSVYFEGIDAYRAKAMTSYIANSIIPFSKHPVHLNSCFSFTIPSYEEIAIPNSTSYETTIYAPDGCIRNAVLDYYRGKLGYVLVRINNIVYNLFDEADAHSNYTIVIDIEPGYFAFAPAREELPAGEKLDGLRDFMLKGFFKNSYDFFDFVTKNKIFTAEEMFLYSIFHSDQIRLKDGFENAKDYLHGASDDDVARYNRIYEIISYFQSRQTKTMPAAMVNVVPGFGFMNYDANYQRYMNKLSTTDFWKNTLERYFFNCYDNILLLGKKYLLNSDGNFPSLNDISISNKDVSRSKFSVMRIVTNCKFNRKGVPNPPVECRKNANRRFIKDFCLKASGYNSESNMNFAIVYLKGDDISDLPVQFNDFLPFSNIVVEDGSHSYRQQRIYRLESAPISDYNDFDSIKSKAKDRENRVVVKRDPLSERKVEFLLDSSKLYTKPLTFHCSEESFNRSIRDAGINAKYFIPMSFESKRNYHAYIPFDIYNNLCDGKILYVNDLSKGVQKFLTEDIGLSRINLDVNVNRIDYQGNGFINKAFNQTTFDKYLSCLSEPEVASDLRNIYNDLASNVDSAVLNSIFIEACSNSKKVASVRFGLNYMTMFNNFCERYFFDGDDRYGDAIIKLVKEHSHYYGDGKYGLEEFFRPIDSDVVIGYESNKMFSDCESRYMFSGMYTYSYRVRNHCDLYGISANHDILTLLASAIDFDGYFAKYGSDIRKICVNNRISYYCPILEDRNVIRRLVSGSGLELAEVSDKINPDKINPRFGGRIDDIKSNHCYLNAFNDEFKTITQSSGMERIINLLNEVQNSLRYASVINYYSPRNEIEESIKGFISDGVDDLVDAINQFVATGEVA